MFSKAFWGSLGLLWGALRGLLGALWATSTANITPVAHRSQTGRSRINVRHTFLELFLSFLMLFFSPLFVLLFSMSFFIFSRSLLRSILSSQADPPTFKNLDFAPAGARFLKNHNFRSKNGFESVLGLSWAPFGGSWGSLGGSLGPLDRPKKPPDSSWISLGPRSPASCCRIWS